MRNTYPYIPKGLSTEKSTQAPRPQLELPLRCY